MASAREIAIELLPHFRESVLAHHVHTYGYYAEAIGRKAASDSMAIGQAMHALGAACILAGVPVAPLFFVERADSEWRGVFQSDSAERLHVLPHYDLLYVTAREYVYATGDFERVDRALRVVFPKHLRPDQLSPHDLWHVLIYAKLKNGATILETRLAQYRQLLVELKARRAAS
jgi:hypothetical protein